MQGFFCRKKLHGLISVGFFSGLLLSVFSVSVVAGTVSSFPSKKQIKCDSLFSNFIQEPSWEEGTLFRQQDLSKDAPLMIQDDFFQTSEQFRPHLDYKKLLHSFETSVALQKLRDFREQIQSRVGIYKSTILLGEPRASVFPLIQKKAHLADIDGLRKYKKAYGYEFHVDVSKDRFFVSAVHLALLDALLEKNLPVLELFLEHDEFPLSILVLKRLKDISISADSSKEVLSQWSLVLHLYENKAIKLVEKLKPQDALYPDLLSYFAEKWVFSDSSSKEMDIFLDRMLQSLDKSSLKNPEVQKYLLKSLHRLFIVSAQYSVSDVTFQRLQKIFRRIQNSVELRKSRHSEHQPQGMSLLLGEEASVHLGYLSIEFFWDQLRTGHFAEAMNNPELSQQWMRGFYWIALYEAQGSRMKNDFISLGTEFIQKKLAKSCVEWLLPRLR